LKANDRLTDFVLKYGPLDPGDPKQLALLEGTGITVE
jgi:hypothetical protein